MKLSTITNQINMRLVLNYRFRKQNATFRKAILLLVLLACGLFWPCSQSVLAQGAVTVKGKVSGENNSPLSGASVSVKETRAGVTAGADGNYSIDVATGATLIFSFINYATAEIKVNSKTVINVTLILAERALQNEVVVVGYGTQRKEAITGSVASIGGDKLREVPAPNITQAIQGRLAGVELSQTSTRPGATMQIRIRGTRSLSADNNPLVVLDGIPFIGSLADINPNDIKSVEILKDASATAIYGSRGANGVILVTTEKGGKGRKARVTYSSYTGTQKIFAKYPMMNGAQLTKLRTDAGNLFTNGTDEAAGVDTDWQELLYRTGIVSDHNVSLTGGSETGSYSFGGGYHLNQGVIPTQKYNRYSFRASIDQQIGKNFRVGFTSNSNFNQSKGQQVGLYNNLSMSPLAGLTNPDGSVRRSIRMQLDNQFVYTKDIIEQLTEDNLWINESRGMASYNSLYGEVRLPFVTGLKYRVNLGADFIQNNGGSYTGRGVGDGLNPNTVSSAAIDYRQTLHWTVENILSYDRTFGGKHNVNAIALYSAEQNKYNRTNLTGLRIFRVCF